MNWYKKADGGLSVWLDDLRKMPPEYDIHVKTANEAIEVLRSGRVIRMSLDHDLGEGNGSGYDVAKWIEEAAYNNDIPQIQLSLHSQNTVGIENMRSALVNAHKFWQGHQEKEQEDVEVV